MPKRLAVLILLTFIPVVTRIIEFIKKYKWENWKSDLGEICFGIIWISLFIWLLVGLAKFIINIIN